MQPCVYILASAQNGTLYVGVTSDIIKRVWEHKNDVVEGFTKTYQVHTLVWVEQHENMYAAIMREKAIKAWKRAWKIKLIETNNPEWQDLYDGIIQLGCKMDSSLRWNDEKETVISDEHKIR